MTIIKIILSIFFWIFPWFLRRSLLISVFKYKISPRARIGYSIIIPDNLEMLDDSRIGHLTVCKGISNLKLGVSSRIGNLNWITGFPKSNVGFFNHRVDRDPCLIVGNHSAITHRHLIDCTDKVIIGDFTTMAGNGSQILTHSIDIYISKQDCEPVKIGSYCMIGTASVLLPGSALPDYCILGAASLLNKVFTEEYCLYGGVPAKLVKSLPADAKYFSRRQGFIH